MGLGLGAMTDSWAIISMNLKDGMYPTFSLGLHTRVENPDDKVPVTMRLGLVIYDYSEPKAGQPFDGPMFIGFSTVVGKVRGSRGGSGVVDFGSRSDKRPSSRSEPKT